MNADDLDFETWLAMGVQHGWVGPPVCSTHDGLPTSHQENQLWEEGEDWCIFVMRLYESDEHRLQVEEAHSPSVWRKTNRGLS
jgi:hypothetical protein